MKLSAHQNTRQHLILELLTLALVALLCALVGALLTETIAQLGGFSSRRMLDVVANLQENDVEKRSFIKVILLTSHLFTFIVPSLLLALILHKRNAFQYLRLHQAPIIQNLLYGGVWMLLALPFIMLIFWLNQQIPLGIFAQDLENQAGLLTEKLLVMTNIWELLFSLLVIAIIPSIGEELMFRGIFQPLFSKIFNNPHVGVWLAAILFSAIHLQFEGFLPRMILGALLGYLFLWTNNLWVAIFGHFVNNGVQLVAVYTTNMDIEQQTPELSKIWLPSLLSLALVAALGYYIYQFNQKQSVKEIDLTTMQNEKTT